MMVRNELQPDRTDRVLILLGALLAILSILFVFSMMVEVPGVKPAVQDEYPTEIVVLPEVTLPSLRDYSLIFASSERALVLFNGHIFLLREGSPLPDATHLAEFVFQNGYWAIANSDGLVLEPLNSLTMPIGS
jgi:hypothetical protein